MNHRIIDFKTGKPMSDEPPKEKSFEENHAELCEGYRKIFVCITESLGNLRDLCENDPNLARSIHWYNDAGYTETVAVALRETQQELRWLERFYAGMPSR